MFEDYRRGVGVHGYRDPAPGPLDRSGERCGTGTLQMGSMLSSPALALGLNTCLQDAYSLA